MPTSPRSPADLPLPSTISAPLSADEALAWTRRLAFADVGHSREVNVIGEQEVEGRRCIAVHCAFETGFGVGRQRHEYVVALMSGGIDDGPLIVTADAALAAAAWRPGFVREHRGPRWLVAGDPRALERCGAALTAWVEPQAAGLSVEWHAGFAAAYEVGPADASRVERLVQTLTTMAIH